MTIEYGKEYDYQDVKELVKERQLYILDEVVKICEKHGLIYWLDGGTLLGAVRHKGFIPWDDDIDIGMMREDYEKLIPLLKKELPSDLVVQSRKSDIKYKLPFVKIRDRYSKIEKDFEFNGIFIDIFPFDLMPKSPWLKKIQRVSFMLLEAAMIHTDTDKLNISKKEGLKHKVLLKAMNALSMIGSLLGEKSFYFFYNTIKSISKVDPSEEVGDGLTASWAYYKSIRPQQAYLPTNQAVFETKMYRVPHDTQKYLSTLYGDNFMTPVQFENTHVSKVTFFEEMETKL